MVGPVKRVVKEGLSAIVLVLSVIGLFYFVSSSNFNGLAVLVMACLVLLSMGALVVYSKTGSRVSGSEGEWVAAGAMNPLILLFKDMDSPEDILNEERKDRRRDEDYYRRRSN